MGGWKDEEQEEEISPLMYQSTLAFNYRSAVDPDESEALIGGHFRLAIPHYTAVSADIETTLPHIHSWNLKTPASTARGAAGNHAGCSNM